MTPIKKTPEQITAQVAMHRKAHANQQARHQADRIRDAAPQLLEALRHAVNWGEGYQCTAHIRPAYMDEAIMALAAIDDTPRTPTTDGMSAADIEEALNRR
jgi:hypothetical protein